MVGSLTSVFPQILLKNTYRWGACGDELMELVSHVVTLGRVHATIVVGLDVEDEDDSLVLEGDDLPGESRKGRRAHKLQHTTAGEEVDVGKHLK